MIIRNDPHPLPLGLWCFWCTRGIESPPYVVWLGFGGKEILLHPECAHLLGAGLLVDAFTIRLEARVN